MRILGMDTSTDAMSVALTENSHLIGEIFCQVKAKHSETLMESVDALLKRTDMRLSDIDALAVCVGPGSFTGVRIGVASMSALAYVTGADLYSVSTLDALIEGAVSALPMEREIVAMLDARRDQVYVKGVRVQQEHRFNEVIPEEATSLSAVEERLSHLTAFTCTGDGALAHKEELKQRFGPRVAFVPEERMMPHASSACALVARGIAEKCSPAGLRPVYLRAPQAQREREKRLGLL